MDNVEKLKELKAQFDSGEISEEEYNKAKEEYLDQILAPKSEEPTRAEMDTQPIPVVEKFCPNCGKAMPSDQSFCASCGTNVDAMLSGQATGGQGAAGQAAGPQGQQAPAAQPVIQPAPTVHAAQSTQPIPVVQAAPGVAAAPAQVAQNDAMTGLLAEQLKSNRRIIFIFAAIICLLIVGLIYVTTLLSDALDTKNALYYQKNQTVQLNPDTELRPYGADKKPFNDYTVYVTNRNTKEVFSYTSRDTFKFSQLNIDNGTYDTEFVDNKTGEKVPGPTTEITNDVPKEDKKDVADISTLSDDEVTPEPEFSSASYKEVVQNLVNTYGSTNAKYDTPEKYATKFATGLCYARLVDMNVDGIDELILVYSKERYGCRNFEIWSYDQAASKPVMVYKGEVSTHETNGYFPYIEICERTDVQGYVIKHRMGMDSDPISDYECLIGFDGNACGVLAERSFSEERSGTVYFEGALDGKKISKERHTELFAKYIGSNGATWHNHLYEMQLVPCPAKNCQELSATMTMTQETLKKILSGEDNSKADSKTNQNTAKDTYNQGDKVSLTGTLCSETVEYKGEKFGTLILKLDTPINANVGPYSNQYNIKLYNNVNSISLASFSGEAYGYVGKKVRVEGYLVGGDKHDYAYDANGKVAPAPECAIDGSKERKITGA